MSELYLEILDDPVASALAVGGASSSVLEISIQQSVVTYSVEIQEFIEIIEQGPTGNPGPTGPPDTSGLAFILYNGSAYAQRNTVTTDPLRVVVWIGPVAPAIDATYALDNVDIWWNTTG